MTTRADVVACARTWLHTPYHHRASVKGVGADCSGLILGVARELALVAPDFALPLYTGTPDGHSMIEWADRLMVRIERAAMQPGDVIVATIDADPQHLGILGDYRHGGLSLIHAATTQRTVGWVVETRLMFSRVQRFVAAYSLPGVEG